MATESSFDAEFPPPVSMHASDSMPYRHGSLSSSTTTGTLVSSVNTASEPYQKKETTRGQFTARPSLVTFECPSYVPSESYDDSGEFYDSEMAAGEDLRRQMAKCLRVFPDVSSRTVRLILQRFIENFLGWIPLFEPVTVHTVVNQACTNGFPTDSSNSPNSCLAMLILATGSILQTQTDTRLDALPGLDYFAHGSQMLDRFSFLDSSLTTLHCRILQAVYLKLTLHPVLSWNVIMQATRDCMNVLSTQWFKRLDTPAQEPWHRAFWACSIMSEYVTYSHSLFSTNSKVNSKHR